VNILEAAVAGSQPEHAATYSEATRSLRLHPKWGTIWVRLMDAASGLSSVDAPAPRQEPPQGGWGDDVCEIEGRPVKPLDPAIRQRVIAENRARAMREGVRACSTTALPAVRRVSAATPRERRCRSTRRTRQASRDGPSDESEGDPELGASPSASQLSRSAHSHGRRT
jgi:gamma-glutamyl:cysteine ligase YbdK (ATP-grasp superfamily)